VFVVIGVSDGGPPRWSDSTPRKPGTRRRAAGALPCGG
jgi:hypothetical protein